VAGRRASSVVRAEQLVEDRARVDVHGRDHRQTEAACERKAIRAVRGQVHRRMWVLHGSWHDRRFER